jgi:hypothetical protein
MLGLLSIIPQALSAVTAYFTKRTEVDLEKYKVDGQVDINAVNAEVEIVKASKDIQRDKWMQWGFVAPTVAWYVAIIIDCVFQRLTGWKYDVLALPPQVEYVPHAIIGFLFVYKMIKR